MVLTPTIFVDEHLLDDIYGKRTRETLNLELSLNPKLGMKTVSLSIVERIERLIKFLEKAGELERIRPCCSIDDRKDAHLGTRYVLETCTATRVFIPTRNDPEPHFKGLVIWLSLPQIPSEELHSCPPGMLCLLENFYNGETRFCVSGYTLLLSLLNEMRGEFERTILSKAFPEYKVTQDWQSRWRAISSHIKSFINNPFKMLHNMGCIPSEERRIEALYLVRAYGPEEGDSGNTTSVFGYPVFIRNA